MNGRVVAVNAKAGETAEAGKRAGGARGDEDGACAERAAAVRVTPCTSRPGASRARAICWSSWSRMKAHPALTDEHEALREPCAASSQREIPPHAAAWDEAAEFPRELYGKAAAAGLLGIGFPEEYGGTPADLFTHVILAEEFALAGVGGVQAGLFSHYIGSPPIATRRQRGTEAARAAVVLAGEKISALAITEPSGGSDVANLRRRAAGRQRLCRQRREDLHHLRHARGLLHRRGAHRRGRRIRRVAAADRARPRGLHAHAAEKNGLVVLRHRDACISTMCACRPAT